MKNSSSKKNDLLFVGNFVKKTETLCDQRFSQAGMLFQNKFINFIQPEKTIALIPIFYNQLDGIVCTDLANNIVYIGSKNKFTVRFFISKFYRVIKDTILSLAHIKKGKSRNVFFYNIDQHNYILSFMTKHILRRKVFIVLADYSVYKSRVFNWLYNRFLKSIDGVIVLSPHVKCNANTKLLLGLVDDSRLRIVESEHINKNVLLSGSLGETTGFGLALEYFKYRKDINLYITGKPFRYSESEFKNLIESVVRPSENIEYLGLLDYEDYIEVLEKCDVTLSLRNPCDDEHEYNFPSKILEYLAASKIVITTKKYAGLPNDLVYFSEFNIKGLDTVFEKIYAASKNEINVRKKRAHNYLFENFTKNRLNDVVRDLIEGAS